MNIRKAAYQVVAMDPKTRAVLEQYGRKHTISIGMEDLDALMIDLSSDDSVSDSDSSKGSCDSSSDDDDLDF